LTEYLEINLELLSRQESEQEFVLALLADFGFEGFREEEGRIFAYIGTDVFRSAAFTKRSSIRSVLLPNVTAWN
jgi:hypothetical protein